MEKEFEGLKKDNKTLRALIGEETKLKEENEVLKAENKTLKEKMVEMEKEKTAINDHHVRGGKVSPDLDEYCSCSCSLGIQKALSYSFQMNDAIHISWKSSALVQHRQKGLDAVEPQRECGSYDAIEWTGFHDF